MYIPVYTGLLFVYFDIHVYGLYIHVYLMHHFWRIMSAFSMARVPSTPLSWRKTRDYNFSTSCWPTFSRGCLGARVWPSSPSPHQAQHRLCTPRKDFACHPVNRQLAYTLRFSPDNRVHPLPHHRLGVCSSYRKCPSACPSY